MRLRHSKKNAVQSESTTIFKGGNDDGFWHCEGFSATVSGLKKPNRHRIRTENSKAEIGERDECCGQAGV